MLKPTFKEAICQLHGIDPSAYAAFVLERSLYLRVRLLRPVLAFFYPEFLFNELQLIEKIAHARCSREIQEEIDYYHHKYVVDYLWKDVFCFRISGIQLMRLASAAFPLAGCKLEAAGVPAPLQDSFNP